MGNKTIYVRNEELWERAKQLAGKEGLSALIAEALQAYLDRQELEERGFKKYRLPYRLEVGRSDPDGPADTPFGAERIAFEGRLLAEVFDGLHLTEVYLTKAGKLLVLSSIQGIVTDYGACDSIAQLGNHPQVAGMENGQARASILDQVAKSLGQDWAIQIE